MTNDTLTKKIVSYDTQGAIIYIFGVLIWYAIAFVLILIDNINPRTGRIKRYKHTNVYQAVNNLHEHKTRNDILNELKDKDKRQKLWNIYYGNKENSPLNVAKDQETVDLIIKQLNELNGQRRLLENTLNDMNLEQSDIDETESNNSI